MTSGSDKQVPAGQKTLSSFGSSNNSMSQQDGQQKKTILANILQILSTNASIGKQSVPGLSTRGLKDTQAAHS